MVAGQGGQDRERNLSCFSFCSIRRFHETTKDVKEKRTSAPFIGIWAAKTKRGLCCSVITQSQGARRYRFTGDGLPGWSPPSPGHSLVPLTCTATRVGRAGWHFISTVLPSIAVHIKKSLRMRTLNFCSCLGICLVQGFSTWSPLQDMLDAKEDCGAPKQECMGKGVRQCVVHTLTSAAALVESKCFFPPPVFSADFCASTK